MKLDTSLEWCVLVSNMYPGTDTRMTRVGEVCKLKDIF